MSCQLFRSVLPVSELTSWHLKIDQAYERVEAIRQAEGLAAIPRVLPSNERFVPTASSFTVGAVFAENDTRKIFVVLEAASVLATIRNNLGDAIACNVTQSWIRRQYPPGQSPSMHAPHAWHQDGALGFDFMACGGRRLPADALLHMMTVWIALDPCGVESPGLELVRGSVKMLIAPSELSDAVVRRRFHAETFWRPVMEAGDALAFSGEVLHRTHVNAEMTKTRTSLELRFFSANDIPPRLKSDRFVPLF